jgi:hypothetical protein
MFSQLIKNWLHFVYQCILYQLFVHFLPIFFSTFHQHFCVLCTNYQSTWSLHILHVSICVHTHHLHILYILPVYFVHTIFVFSTHYLCALLTLSVYFVDIICVFCKHYLCTLHTLSVCFVNTVCVFCTYMYHSPGFKIKWKYSLNVTKNIF